MQPRLLQFTSACSTIIAISAACSLGAQPRPAQAAPSPSGFYEYTFKDVIFNGSDSKGTVQGYFVLNPTTQEFGPFDVVTSPGKAFNKNTDGVEYSDSEGAQPDFVLETSSLYELQFAYYGTADEYLDFALVPKSGTSDLHVSSLIEFPPIENGQATRSGRGGTLIALPLDAATAVTSITAVPATLAGGSEGVMATVTLDGVAPTGGVNIGLATPGNTVADVPTTLIVPAGSASANFLISVGNVSADKTVTVTAGYNGSSQSVTLTVTPQPTHPALASVFLAPSTVKGGAKITQNRIYLTGDAPNLTEVALSSSNPSVAAVAPDRIVNAGFSSRKFTIQTAPVLAPTPVTITATLDGVIQSATLIVTP